MAVNYQANVKKKLICVVCIVYNFIVLQLLQCTCNTKMTLLINVLKSLMPEIGTSELIRPSFDQ